MPRSSKNTVVLVTLFAFLGTGAIAFVVKAGEAAKEAVKEVAKDVPKEAPKEVAKPLTKEIAKPGDKGVGGAGGRDATADNAVGKTANGGRGGADVAKTSGAERRAAKDKKSGKNDDSGPPLDIKGLRAEIRREAPPAIAIDSPEPPETKVEKMLSEVTKAREALHADTMRLEALLAQENDQASPPGAAGTPGKGAGKPPLEILAKALRGIKADQAAPIVSRLDRHLASIVLMRMPPVDAGKILGAMKPEVAAEISTLIALKKVVAEGRAEVKK